MPSGVPNYFSQLFHTGLLSNAIPARIKAFLTWSGWYDTGILDLILRTMLWAWVKRMILGFGFHLTEALCSFATFVARQSRFTDRTTAIKPDLPLVLSLMEICRWYGNNCQKHGKFLIHNLLFYQARLCSNDRKRCTWLQWSLFLRMI